MLPVRGSTVSLFQKEQGNFLFEEDVVRLGRQLLHDLNSLQYGPPGAPSMVYNSLYIP
jgi:hypothetical protein